jgi:hypothetical protein
MAVANGYGKTITSGSVFMYDVGDAVNSYKGKPTTNFYTNGHFAGGTGIPQEGGSNATNTIIQLANPGNSLYVLQQTMGVAYTEYQINLTNQLQSNTTYVLSGWYAESADYVGASRMFHCRAFSTSGAHVALGTGIGTVLKTVQIGGITWRLCYATITTPADYSNDFNWYVGYDGGSYTGARYYTNLMMEVGTTPSQFVDGTRSSTQALLPLVGNSSIDLSNVSFDSNAQMIFDGTNDTISSPSDVSNNIAGNITMELVLNRTDGYASAVMHKDVQYTLYIAADGAISYADSSYWSYGAFGFHYAAITPGLYHHIVATKNGSLVTIYVDGNVAISQNFGSAITQTNNNLYIGSYNGGSAYFAGKIPIAKLYNRAISLSEVRQNYNNYKTRFNLP